MAIPTRALDSFAGTLAFSEPGRGPGFVDTISHHLKTLVDVGVIARERRGKWSYYSIINQRLTDLGIGIERLGSRVAAKP